jgi:hypothetical protein
MAEIRYATGWMRDLPDIRDYRPETPEIRSLLEHSSRLKAKPMLPPKVDSLT